MSLLAVLHLILSASLLLYSLTLEDAHGREIYSAFSDYVQSYNKSYKPGTTEYSEREMIFKESLKRIEELNRNRNGSHEVRYGVNQFSDMTPEEFQEYVKTSVLSNDPRYRLKKRKPPKLSKAGVSGYFLPKKVDWRQKNVITRVRNQEKCGACWAFSTVETIEAMYALKYGTLEEWSVQQMIDCAPKPNQGCEGGDTCLAIEWLYQNKINLDLEKDYPFTGDSGLCKFKTSTKTVRIADNFTCDDFVGEEELMLFQLAYHGPLVAAVDATGWQDYLGGVIQYHCEDDRNHAVQIVGYDLTADVPYYIVRNSWGTAFGHDGYIYIAYGKNMCGIAEEVSSLDVL